MAQVDLDRARAVLAESKDFYIPSAAASAGVGKGVGAPLSPPVIFSVAAQSLVFSFSQRDYIRAGHSGVRSAELALDVARTDVSEDTINTYLALDNAQRRHRVQAEAFGIASRLVEIVDERFAAGLDAHTELIRAKRTAMQIHLQELQAEDETASNQEHLAALTGLPATGWQTVPESIPELHLPSDPAAADLRDPNVATGTSAAFASAQARQYTARGDQRALRHPQVNFSAQYSRLSDAFNTYDIYYPGFFQQFVNGQPTGPRNSANSLSAGIEISLPLVDTRSAGAAAAPLGPSAAPATSPALPVTVGAEPASTAPDSSAVPAGSSPAPVPTTGSVPSALPSSPVTVPPAPAPPNVPHR